jgi:hypothetical protein
VKATNALITAWENAKNARKVMQEVTHQEALRRFFESGFGNAVGTSVWVADRFNTTWVRCNACGMLAASKDKEEQCECGSWLQGASVLVM